MSNKEMLLGGGIVLMALFTACGGQQETGQGAQSYRMITVATGEKEITSRYSASIRGKSDIDIFPQVAGYITAVCVSEGAQVRTGQTLFVIDQVPYQAALQTATANVNLATANVNTAQLMFDSKQELFDKGVVSSFELRTAANALEIANAQLEQAQAMEVIARNNLSYTIVKSPSNGVVGVLPFKVGASVSPAQQRALTQISDNSVMYVYFSMTENRLLALVRQYESVEKAIQAMPMVRLELSDRTVYDQQGKIETVSGVIDTGTGTVSLRATFHNPNGLLHSGGAGNVLIPTQYDNCITIPKSATFEIQDQIYVYKNVDGIAQSTRINISPLSEDNDYIVTDGLKAGDVIVAEGVGFIRDGQTITNKQN